MNFLLVFLPPCSGQKTAMLVPHRTLVVFLRERVRSEHSNLFQLTLAGSGSNEPPRRIRNPSPRPHTPNDSHDEGRMWRIEIRRRDRAEHTLSSWGHHFDSVLATCTAVLYHSEAADAKCLPTHTLENTDRVVGVNYVVEAN